MANSIKRIKASDGSGNAVVATVTVLRAALATTQHVNSVTGIYAGAEGFYGTMGTPHTFTDPITGETITVISDATAVDFQGHIDTGNIIIDAIAPGYVDAGSKVGDIVVIRPTTQYANNVSDTFAAAHKDDGTHGNITVDSILLNSNNQDLSNHYLYLNAIINGGCMVAQRAVPSLSTSYQYGKVDRFAAKASGTAVSAGTITQLTSSLLAATKGYDLQIAGVTVTGTGIVYLRYRMEAKDAQAFVNAVASFGCRVYHNVGSNINYTIYIRKANAADNFTAVTDIANSGAISVPSATATTIKFENINSGSLGDVSNGIEIEIQIACGAITTKNFNFAEFVFAKGSKAQPYMPRSYQHELESCLRYYEQPGYAEQGRFSSTTQIKMMAKYKVPKRVAPTCTLLTTTPAFEETSVAVRTGSGSTLVASAAGVMGGTYDINGFTANSGATGHSLQDAWSAADAEL
jgi:hypothetical protein